MDGKELSQVQAHLPFPSYTLSPRPELAELGPEGSDRTASLSRVAPSSHSLSHTLCGRYTPRDLRCPHCEPCTTPSTLRSRNEPSILRPFQEMAQVSCSADSWFPWAKSGCSLTPVLFGTWVKPA